MKPVFCTDVTDNKHSAAIHGEEFIFATLSDDTRREINITMEEAAKPLKQAELPLPLRLLRYAGLCLAMVMGITMFDGGFQPMRLLLCLVGIAVYIGLAIYTGKRKEALVKKLGAEPMMDAMEKVTHRVMEELEIPADAITADVICFRYKEKEGKREVVLAAGGVKYVNVEVYCYKNDTHLFLADMERVYAIPLQGLRTITAVHEPITLARWNKPYDPRQYGLEQTARGTVPTDVHYILEFTADGEDYGIYFPVYELEAIKQLTGLDEGE